LNDPYSPALISLRDFRTNSIVNFEGDPRSSFLAAR
jgi:hypothetical protein